MGSLRARQMDEILQTFMAFDYEGEQRVHADDFQKALATLGLKLGDPQVDAVMALCRIDTDTGYVSVSCPSSHTADRCCGCVCALALTFVAVMALLCLWGWCGAFGAALQVDFSALPGEINRIKEDSKSRDTGFYTPSATPASGKVRLLPVCCFPAPSHLFGL